jgi:hypothetical protein
MASIQGWGRQTWNSGAWNQQAPVSVTGNGLTSSLGTETVATDQNISVTGVGLTSAVGTAVAVGIAQVNPSGNPLTFTIGTETVTTDQNISVTGNSLTSSVGDDSQSVTSTTGWNRDTDVNTGDSIGWNEQQWGAVGGSFALTGQALGASLGTETVTTDQNISVTGVATTSSIGTFSISGDSQVTVVAASEPELDISVGTAQADPEFVVFPSGNAMTSAVGTVGTSVFLTGVNMTSSLGDETQETSYEAPSVSLTLSTGTIQIRTDVSFTPTGVSVTSSTGNLQGTFWSVVDDSNSDISWTEVHQAA